MTNTQVDEDLDQIVRHIMDQPEGIPDATWERQIAGAKQALIEWSADRESHKGTEETIDLEPQYASTKTVRAIKTSSEDYKPTYEPEVEGTGEGETLDEELETFLVNNFDLDYSIEKGLREAIVKDREQYADLKVSKAIAEFKLWISSNDKSGEDDRDYVIDSGDLLLYGLPDTTKEKL